MKSTSRQSSDISDIEIWVSKNGTTRKILRAEVIQNTKNRENSVKIALVHQRRSRTEEWQDLKGVPLSQLHAGEAAKMQLDSEATSCLFRHLGNLYQIGKQGPRPGRSVLVIAEEDEVIRTDVGRARVIRKLLAGRHSGEIWKALIEDSPDLATKMAMSRIFSERKIVVERFQNDIGKELGEQYWQEFLDSHHWIFGSSYRSVIGERRIGIKSTVDYPLITEDGHLEIVEIKSPEEEFWRRGKDGSLFQYRKKYLVPSSELQCAVIQATNYILEIEKVMDSKTFAAAHGGIFPIKPKCLVVLGRSADWSTHQWEAFRLLNDSLHGVTILTFDHLLLRAKQVLELFSVEEE